MRSSDTTRATHTNVRLMMMDLAIAVGCVRVRAHFHRLHPFTLFLSMCEMSYSGDGVGVRTVGGEMSVQLALFYIAC